MIDTDGNLWKAVLDATGQDRLLSLPTPNLDATPA